MRSKHCFHYPKFCGSTIMGERGQVVVPMEVRKSLKLREGQKFLVMVHDGAIFLMPEKQMEDMLKKLTKIFKIKS